MVDAIVSSLVQQLTSFIDQEMREEVRLVVGVDKEVGKLTNNLQAIHAVLIDAERRQVKKETAVTFWLDQLKDASYDMEDVLDEWNTARQKWRIEGDAGPIVPQKKVRSFLPTTCFGGFKQVVIRHDIARKIKEIHEKLDDIARAKNHFNFSLNVIKSIDEKSERVQSISLIDDSEICGRVIEKSALISKLVCESSDEQTGLHILSLVGMGGIGKTTLAQLAYNNDQVKRNFEKTLWVCVSQSFDEFRIAKAIIESLNCPTSNSIELEALMQTICKSIIGKKFLLVLDDVWNEDYNKWEPFYRCLRNGLRGSKILITTRKETIARMMGSTDVISVKELAERECWSLFQRFAFFGRSIDKCEKLEQIGRRIAGKCKGLPLAAKTIGSLLHSKNSEEEWKYIVDSELWEQEELEKGLFTPLLLSYDDLPYMVKRCFLYCAIFPKDYEMFKDELIKLWMAQGYLGVKKNKEMEIIGEEYFHILATRSFFQEFKKDVEENIMRCKMHDIVHDFAQFISKGDCFAIEVPNGPEQSLLNSFQKKVCHSMLTLGEEALFPISICSFQKLRSLLIQGDRIDYSRINKVLAELFRKLTWLRVLDLSVSIRWSGGFKLLEEIPTDIEKLVHLRYINLSCQNMVKLPETLCELYNLQILDVSWCGKLKELPQGIGKLINMRYLLNDFTRSLWLMPVGISRLTNLRRITKFVHDSQGCTFESLKNLKLLRECHLYRLGNVSDVGEANRLQLDKKENLQCLVLNFYKNGKEERKNEEDEQLLEVLQPPLNLKKLEIIGYKGNSIFPSWMMSLNNIRFLNLYECENCEHLPPLGELSSLEKLIIQRIKSLIKVGNEFVRIESNNRSSSSSSSIISFPKLKSLELRWMDKWEDWNYGIETEGEIMPRLSTLKITHCPKLKALPDHLLQTTTLQNLQILGSPILSERYGKGTGEDLVSHSPYSTSRNYRHGLLTINVPQILGFTSTQWTQLLD